MTMADHRLLAYLIKNPSATYGQFLKDTGIPSISKALFYYHKRNQNRPKYSILWSHSLEGPCNLKKAIEGLVVEINKVCKLNIQIVELNNPKMIEVRAHGKTAR